MSRVVCRVISRVLVKVHVSKRNSVTPSTHQVTMPSTQHVVAKTKQRPPIPPAGLLRAAKPMPPPPPIRSYRSSPC
eukprot:213970-Amphidinium_carterae.1